jgi:hypothetical protein
LSKAKHVTFELMLMPLLFILLLKAALAQYKLKA